MPATKMTLGTKLAAVTHAKILYNKLLFANKNQ